MNEYFIFGSQVSGAYYECDWEDFKRLFRRNLVTWDIVLYDFDWQLETGEDLLSNYDGYMGFAKITKDEYLELVGIRDE